MGLFSTECSHCGSIEHTSDNCPHGIFSSNKCRHCGSLEHASDDCPHGIFSSNKCRHCGSLEHASDDCPHGIFSSNKCRHCGSVEHASDDCPHGIFSSNKCRYCGSVNHASDDCPHGIYTESNSKQRTAPSISSGDDNSGASAIGWLIGVGIVVFVVVWLAVNVVLPVALLNSALALTILALVKKERKILFPILALIGGCYMFFDIMNGWLSANFVNNVVKDKNWITAIAYINSAAMGLSTWLLVKPIWVNAKLSLAIDKSKSILLMSSVVLLISIATLLTPILFNTVKNYFNQGFEKSRNGDVTISELNVTQSTNNNSDNSIVDNTNQKVTQNMPSPEEVTTKSFGVFDSVISENERTDISAKLTRMYENENNEVIDQILTNFSFPLSRYYNKYNVSYDSLNNMYNRSFHETLQYHKIVLDLGASQLSKIDNEYKINLFADFESITNKKPDEKKSRRIAILIYMNSNFEITSIYENP